MQWKVPSGLTQYDGWLHNERGGERKRRRRRDKGIPPNFTVGARPGEAYKPLCLAHTVKFVGGLVMIWGCFSKAGIGKICLCEGHMNQDTYKVFLEENVLPSSLTLFPSSWTMLHATQPGQSTFGWRTTISRLCHGQANLQTWNPLKTSGMWSKGRWMVTMWSLIINVKDWWRVCQDAWKLWLKIRVIYIFLK